MGAALLDPIRSAKFGLYGDISGRIVTILRELFPRLEVYSIDDSFVTFDGLKDRERVALGSTRPHPAMDGPSLLRGGWPGGNIEAALSKLVGECSAHQGNVCCPLIAALHG